MRKIVIVVSLLLLIQIFPLVLAGDVTLTLEDDWTTSSTIWTTVALGDLDGNGDLEMVLGCTDDYLYLLNHDGSTISTTSSYTNGGANNWDSHPTLYDIDDDGDTEILICNWNDYFYILNFTGGSLNLEAAYDSGGDLTDNSPAVADIDNDGTDEIVIVSYSEDSVIVLNYTGGTINKEDDITMGSSSDFLLTPTLYDVDGDNYVEILLGDFNSNNFYVLSHDGSTITTEDTFTEGTKWRAMAVADVDDDGTPEICIGNTDNKLYVLSHDGSTITKEASYTCDNDIVRVSIGDVDNDSTDEIVFGSKNGTLYVMNHDGSSLTKEDDHSLSGSIDSQVSLVDTNNSGTLEMVVCTQANKLYILKHDGTTITEIDDATMDALSPACLSTPTVGDVDNDGICEIVAVSDNKVFVYGTGNAPGTSLWTEEGLDAAKTGYQGTDGGSPGPTTIWISRNVGFRGDISSPGTFWYVDDVGFDADVSEAPEGDLAFSSITPSNGTNLVSVGLSQVSLSITESIGDTFNWTIQTIPDVGSNSGNDATNGTKACSVSGLEYDTTYYWKVNATNGNYWMNRTYYFTTESEPEFTYSSENPSNNTNDLSISTSELSITIQNSKGNPFNWTIDTVPDIGNSSANSASNGSKTCSVSGLQHDTTYTWLVNSTDGIVWKNSSYQFTTGSTAGVFWYEENVGYTADVSEPQFIITFSDPSNRSTGVSVSLSQLEISIYYNFGSPFDWTIETAPDIGNSSGFGEATGDKTCSVSGLGYSTTYTWFVNATDGNIWKNKSFWFTTGDAPAPPGTYWYSDNVGYKGDVTFPAISFSDERPTNASNDCSVYMTDINLTITRNVGGTFNWSIDTLPDIGNSSANGESSGTKHCTISGLTYDTTYYWFVNATDGITWTNETFWFNTGSEPGTYWYSDSVGYTADVRSQTPSISNVLPANESTGTGLYPDLTITVSDLQGDNFNITWTTNSTGSWLPFAYNSTCTNGTYIQNASWATSENKTYFWRVSVNDSSGHWNNQTFWFSTSSYLWGNWSPWWVMDFRGTLPSINTTYPTNGQTHISPGSVRLMCNISDMDNNDMNVSFYKYNTSAGWTLIGTNTTVKNGKYYQIVTGFHYNDNFTWSANLTDGSSWDNLTLTFEITDNSTPSLSNLDPSNGETGVELDIGHISFDISDPEGDLMSYNITTLPNIGSENISSVSNGTRTFTFGSLSYATVYQWTINITDGNTYRNKTFSFTTKSSSDNPPSQPTTPHPSDDAVNVSVDISDLSCVVSDPDLDILKTYFYWSNGSLIGTDDSTVSGGTAIIALGTLEFNTTYSWYAVANDTSFATQSTTWSFSTTQATHSISVSPASYEFGYVSFGDTESSSAFTITNTGNMTLSSIEAKISDFEDDSGLYTWSPGSLPGIDTFVMKYYNISSSSYTTLSETYSSVIGGLDNDTSDTFSLVYYAPTISTVREDMTATITLKYTGDIVREQEITLTLSELNETTNNSLFFEITGDHLMRGGIFTPDLFYVTVLSNMTTDNTTFSLPSMYDGKSMVFFTAEQTLGSFQIYGISSTWEFSKVMYDGDRDEFSLDVDDIQDYNAYVIAPNPGFFENSDWWFNWLNNARDLFRRGETLW